MSADPTSASDPTPASDPGSVPDDPRADGSRADDPPADDREAIRETLRALAAGEPPTEGEPRAAAERRALVADAEAALADVGAAARFAESGGFERLRRIADGGSERDLRSRARTVLGTVARFRRAYRRLDPAGSDHFHPALDTSIPAGEVGGDD